MPPLKPATLQRLSTLCPLSSCSRPQACFSTSLPRWPRLRPSAKPSSRPTAVESRSKHPDLASTTPQPSQPSPPSKPSPSPSPAPPETTSKPQPTKPKQPPASSKNHSPISKSHKQTLFTTPLILQSPSTAPNLTLTPSPPQTLQINSTASFFSKGFQFLYSAESLKHHPPNIHVPEIIILGASNVGKSSFLNALVNKPDAARVSARPGKTTLMNAFGIGPPPNIPKGTLKAGEKMPRYSLVLVDTPGYGFKSQASWGDSVWKYIKARKMLRGAVLLLSSEKKLMEQDKWILRTLAEANTRTLVVLTKADKGGGSWTQRCSDMATLLRDELKRISRSVGNGWGEGSGWNPDIHVTAAGMDKVPRLGSGGGVGGVRMSILEMAGFDLQEKEVRKKDETVTYGGKVVSFDDIKWKTG